MVGAGEFVSVRAVRGISDGLADSLICELSDGYRVVIPKNAIGKDSQVKRPGDFGTLVIRRDTAVMLRLV
jgi:hypothetical protein